MSGGRPPGRDLEAFALKKKVLRLETLYDVSRSLTSTREEKALLEGRAKGNGFRGLSDFIRASVLTHK